MDAQIPSSALSLLLGNLPKTWQDPNVLPKLSADGQLYLRCGKCSAESRVSIMNVQSAVRKTVDQPCGGCGTKRRWKSVVHALHVMVRCIDCGCADRQVLTAGERVGCKACGSTRVDISSAEVQPPFPETVWQLADAMTALLLPGVAKRDHMWGRSGKADAKMICGESQTLSFLPDSTAYHNMLLTFAERLLEGHADQSAEGRYWMENIAGNLSKNLLRKTGQLHHGLRALTHFAAVVDAAQDPLDQGLAMHSYAMGSYSLLTMYREETLADLTSDPEFRMHAIAIADDAAGRFEQAAKQGEPGAATQLARILYVIGDLFRVGKATDEQRRTALKYFEQALEDPKFAQSMGFGAAQSFAATVVDLADPSTDELDKAVKLLGPTLDNGKSDRELASTWASYYTMSRLQRRRGKWREANEAALRAAAHALQQFSAIMDERELLKQAETFVPVFEDIACILAKVGGKDDALNAIELSRAATVRNSTMTGAEREAHLKHVKPRQLEDLVPPAVRKLWGDTLGLASRQDFIEYLWDNPIDPAATKVLGRFGNDTSAYLSIFISDDVATGIIWASHASEKQTLDVTQWTPDAEKLRWLRQQRYVDPGAFRERLLEKAVSYTSELFVDPIMPVLNAVRPRHLIVSLPGVFSRLPIEAALRGPAGSALDPEMSLSYLPSLRVGADICDGAPAQTVPPEKQRVLMIGYGGADMPHLAEEAAALKAIWGEQLTMIDGPACTKKSVLGSMRDPYDIVHIMCHGTYSEDAPLHSALHFCPDIDNDALRVTAMDLLTLGWLPRRPVVILSACSTGLTADVRTNSFHGLSGSLFRIGARAIIGSRWPVHDDVAAPLMRRLHEALRRAPGPLDVLLNRAARPGRDMPPIEDWASFGIFGIA